MKNDGANSGQQERATLASPHVRAALTDVERQTRAFIEQRPVTSVLMAIGLGFVVARAAARF